MQLFIDDGRVNGQAISLSTGLRKLHSDFIIADSRNSERVITHFVDLRHHAIDISSSKLLFQLIER